MGTLMPAPGEVTTTVTEAAVLAGTASPRAPCSDMDIPSIMTNTDSDCNGQGYRGCTCEYLIQGGYWSAARSYRS